MLLFVAHMQMQYAWHTVLRKGGISGISMMALPEVTLFNSSTVRGQDEPAGVTAMEVQGKSEGCYVTK